MILQITIRLIFNYYTINLWLLPSFFVFFGVLGAVGDSESAATEDGLDDVFGVVELLSGGPVSHGGYVGMERMVLIIAEMGEFWLRLWVKLRNRVFSEFLGGDWVLSQKPGFWSLWVRLRNRVFSGFLGCS